MEWDTLNIEYVGTKRIYNIVGGNVFYRCIIIIIIIIVSEIQKRIIKSKLYM